jgi:hypothetical protein
MRARTLIARVLREPGALDERALALLRGSVLVQVDAGLAMLASDHPREAIARWNGFLPAAVECVGVDPALARAGEHLRAGLRALGVVVLD